MKYYQSKEDVPINIYNFYMNVWLPVGGVVVFFLALNIFFGSYSEWFRYVALALGIAQAVLNINLIIALRKWKPSVIPLVTAEFVVFCSGLLMVLIYVLKQNSSLVVEVIVSDIIGFTLNLVILLYFYKRKLLFDGVPYKPVLRNVTCPDNLKTDKAEPLCPACGTPLRSREDVFCPNCGKRYDG